MNRPTKWEECERDDLNMISKMIAAGWTPKVSNSDKFHGRDAVNFDLATIPHDPVEFEKSPYRIRKGYDRVENDLFEYWIITHVKRAEGLQDILDKGDGL